MPNDRKLPLLLIDFSKDPDYNVDLTDAAMAKALGGPDAGWTAEKVRLVKSQHGILSNIPQACKGKASCYYKDYCPLDPEVINRDFKDKNCPIEVVAAFKCFAGYVLDLEIEPEDYSDLQLVSDLVRLNMLARRCDLYAKDKPIYEESVSAVNQKTGAVYYEKKPVLAFPMMTQIRKDIKEIYDQLIASRAAKVKRDASMKDVRGASELFSHIRKVGEALMEDTASGNKKRRRLKAEELPALEGEYEEIVEDDSAEREQPEFD